MPRELVPGLRRRRSADEFYLLAGAGFAAGVRAHSPAFSEHAFVAVVAVRVSVAAAFAGIAASEPYVERSVRAFGFEAAVFLRRKGKRDNFSLLSLYVPLVFILFNFVNI